MHADSKANVKIHEWVHEWAVKFDCIDLQILSSSNLPFSRLLTLTPEAPPYFRNPANPPAPTPADDMKIDGVCYSCNSGLMLSSSSNRRKKLTGDFS